MPQVILPWESRLMEPPASQRHRSQKQRANMTSYKPAGATSLWRGGGYLFFLKAQFTKSNYIKWLILKF